MFYEQNNDSHHTILETVHLERRVTKMQRLQTLFYSKVSSNKSNMLCFVFVQSFSRLLQPGRPAGTPFGPRLPRVARGVDGADFDALDVLGGLWRILCDAMGDTRGNMRKKCELVK